MAWTLEEFRVGVETTRFWDTLKARSIESLWQEREVHVLDGSRALEGQNHLGKMTCVAAPEKTS